MSRQPSAAVAQRHEARLARIRALKAEHPFWGARRIWAYVHVVEQLPVNTKRMLRLMREHHLLVRPNRRLNAKRTPTGRKPTPTKPHARWGIGMTKMMVEGVGWSDIVVVLAWSTKTIVGSDAGHAWPGPALARGPG